MTNLIIIDIRSVSSQDKLHECLQEKLMLPDYYGKNLDALFDELTSICEDTNVHLLYSDKQEDFWFNKYQNRVLMVFQDAENENPNLTFAKEKTI